MKPAWILLPLVGSVPLLGGCVASVAANAVDMAVRTAQGQPQGNEQLQPTAGEACRARAAQYGTVRIIDIEQHTASQIIVWGTTENAGVRQSFKCTFTTKITGFKLRTIAAPRPPAGG
jgi:hypothetical protein